MMKWCGLFVDNIIIKWEKDNSCRSAEAGGITGYPPQISRLSTPASTKRDRHSPDLSAQVLMKRSSMWKLVLLTSWHYDKYDLLLIAKSSICCSFKILWVNCPRFLIIILEIDSGSRWLSSLMNFLDHFFCFGCLWGIYSKVIEFFYPEGLLPSISAIQNSKRTHPWGIFSKAM